MRSFAFGLLGLDPFVASFALGGKSCVVFVFQCLVLVCFFLFSLVNVVHLVPCMVLSSVEFAFSFFVGVCPCRCSCVILELISLFYRRDWSLVESSPTESCAIPPSDL